MAASGVAVTSRIDAMLATQLRRLLLEVVRLGMQGERAYAKKGVKTNSSSGTKPSKSIEAVGIIFAMMIDDVDLSGWTPQTIFKSGIAVGRESEKTGGAGRRFVRTTPRFSHNPKWLKNSESRSDPLRNRT